jgi:4-amino-4-deoxy-L-arabinose transferase-like glycosyltransferase
MERKKIMKRPEFIAVLLAFATLILLIATAPDIGLTWDEPAYIAAARSYSDWFGVLFTNPAPAFSQEVIDEHWVVNHEHPPLDKIWSGLVQVASSHLFDDLLAHRLGNMILVAVMVAVLYFWIAKSYSLVAGFTAVAALLGMPRFFFHAHLSALDVPAAFAVFMATFCFAHWVDDRSWKWTLILGLVFGAAFATKVNAFFVPPTLFLWMLIFRRRWYLVFRLGIASLLGTGIFVLLWPWLYPDLIGRLSEYIRFVTVEHWSIGQWYFSKFFMPPPWHFTFVMLWAVVPLTIAFLYFLGAIHSFWQRKRDRGVGVLLIFSSLVPLLALALSGSMVYDNERLFMPAFPFLAALAGIGFTWLSASLRSAVQRLGKSQFGQVLTAILVLIIFLPPLVSTVSLYPHLLSYYSQSVGGLPGATRLGLETTYWCETYAAALPYINENAKPGDTIWVEPWSHDVLVYYQLEGKLRPDLDIAAAQYAESTFGSVDTLESGTPRSAADFVIFQHRQTYFGAMTEQNPITSEWLTVHTPVYRVQYQGIPLMSIYAQP